MNSDSDAFTTYDPKKANPQYKQFKLISVNFKEAALDSPSFRAGINHLDNQISKIERWLLALVSSVKKIPKYAKELQTYCNSFLEHLVPSFLQDGLIDQEYTMQSLQTTLQGLKALWSINLSALNVNSYIIDNLNLIVSKNVSQYKEIRKNFDVYQEKHDRYLELYLATPKTKDAASIMEDAKEFFQVRKDYIHASLDLVVEVATLGNLLDKVLVGLSSDLWKNKRSAFTSGSNASFIKESWLKINRIRGWCDSYSLAIEKLGGDMVLARNQVEESSTHQFQPSSDPNQYKSSLINQKMLDSIDERGVEKHGYLFMKTWTERSSKPIWVRRWAFIKGGVFGLLVLSPSKTFVQETDKIGILLCNVRYTPNEDRRFCFELKTSDLTVVFQAETLIELKSWLKVFQNERNQILQSARENSDSDLFNIASGRYPPIVTEFSSTLQTTMDRELTSSRIAHHSTGQIITPSNLAKHIEKNDKLFSKYVYSQILQIKPPFITDTTKSSILSYSLVKPTHVPTALTANMWGSVNWGIYYLHSAIQDEKAMEPYLIQEDTELIQQQQQRRDGGLFYPNYYPKELIPLDIQMRALFETVIQPGEYCLISYRCIWSANSKQELSGRCFITLNHAYFYMQALGFVTLFKGYVGNMISVEYKLQKQFDLVKMYTIAGVIKMKLFLDDGKAMKLKVNYLIDNKVSDKPKLTREILQAFNKIDEQLEKEKIQQEQYDSNEVEEKDLSSQLTGAPNLTGILKSSSLVKASSKTTSYRTDFTKDYRLIKERRYAVPPKAIFHALLGDNSTILNEQLSFGRVESIIKKPWISTPEGVLKRTFNTIAAYNKKRWVVQISQAIDELHDDEYYVFSHTRSNFKFLIGSVFNVEYKFVMLRTAGDQTRLYSYVRRNYFGTLIFNPFVDWISQTVAANRDFHFNDLLKSSFRELGTHGTVVKSIYIYGKLSHTDDSEEEKDEEQIAKNPPIMRVSFFYVIKVFTKRVMFRIINFLLQLIQIIINAGVLLFRSLRMQTVLLLIIFVSAVFNLFLMGKTTQSYWSVRRANNIAYELLTNDPLMLQRAIYLKDTEELLERGKHDFYTRIKEVTPNLNHLNQLQNSKSCFETFKNNSFVINYKDSTDWDNVYGDDETRNVAKDLKKAHQDVGIRRHKLMVELEILSLIEELIAKAEWRNWLMSEVQRCDYVESTIVSRLVYPNEEGEVESLGDGIDSLLDYCQNCKEEFNNIDLI
ncbi:Snf1p protein-interacting protein [Suhomyces tanzawaensis NRRL Y-17324]|uniref:Snf1p protein-interacting protein n=1 Tax=Suhomyces tanzawaensis NRRL Y-17324 TaxID=984487 RepID=A0A1E4SLF8_9ASCO|nr:Snf1p protein-interacting protein [Suhomyces tanzawaensis NRRL Y-17324]ODV80330.1 Snf1p protein-interacting protein [Suhomyces tanzawaensis NRRL Y-17324]